MTLKVLVAAFFSLWCASVVAACSAASDPITPDFASTEGGGPSAADAAIDDAPAAQDKPNSQDGEGGFDGGIGCRTRCEKAGCADLEACIELCAKKAAKIPSSCQAEVSALEACVDASGTWKCDRGEAVGNGPCSKEALSLLNCVLAKAVDGGMVDAATDAGGHR